MNKLIFITSLNESNRKVVEAITVYSSKDLNLNLEQTYEFIVSKKSLADANAHSSNFNSKALVLSNADDISEDGSNPEVYLSRDKGQFGKQKKKNQQQSKQGNLPDSGFTWTPKLAKRYANQLPNQCWYHGSNKHSSRH